MKRRFMPPMLLASCLVLAGFLAALRPAHAQNPPPDEEPEMTFDEDDVKKPPAKPARRPAAQKPAAQKPAAQKPAAQKPAAGKPPSGQPEPDEPEPDQPEPEGEITLGADPTADAASRKTELGDTRVSWQDIVVVVRKPFLKQHRIEVLPMLGVTMNDNIIRHVQFSGTINYYLTDVLAIGLEGQYYVKDLREPYILVPSQARRLPTVNKYNYGAALNFHYVPIYGKFAILDQHIIHWETFFTAGVGFTQSEAIPRDPANEAFKNFLITPNVGVSMRFFVTKFMTINAGIRDYIFSDKFEAVDRTEVDGDDAKRNADSSFINSIIFQAGISFWFPMSFDYTTFR